MTIDEVTQYWLPAVRNLYGRYGVSTETCLGLDELLGLHLYHEYRNTDFTEFEPLPGELKKLLVMLAGPHGKTILKMYRIKRSLE